MDAEHKVAHSIQHDGGYVAHRTTITDLPETIIHHIVSSLSIKDVARVSVVSRQWRYLCYTTPCLNLDVDGLCRGNKVLREKVVSFIGRLLVLRHPTQLERFILTCSRSLVSAYDVETWILYAIKCNVQELHLDICLKSFVLPIDIFTLTSLRTLHLDMNRQYVKLPPFVGLANLKSLRLVSAHLRDDPLSGWLSNPCLSLEHLTLDGCYGFNTLNIISSSILVLSVLDPQEGQLHHLNISCPNLKLLYVALYSPYHAHTSFKLFAPKLRVSFMKFGRTVDCCQWNPFESLQKAFLDIYCCNDWKAVFAFGSQLLNFLTKAEGLFLCSVSTQVLAWKLKEDPSLSLNIKSLKFQTHLSCDETMLIKHLLGRAPDLKNLYISREKYHESQLLHEDVSNEIRRAPIVVSAHHLKIARISLLGSGERSLTFAKWLLSNLKVLERLDIIYLPSDAETAKEMKQELEDSVIASPYAKVYLISSEEKDGIY